LLLQLLPPERRAREGEQMTIVFADLARSVRRDAGFGGMAALWIRETIGMARFAWRERLGGRRRASNEEPPVRSTGGPGIGQELHWALRSVRARGGRAVLIAGLLAVALAANALVFAVTDSVLFRRVPYPEPERIVEILSVRREGRPGDNFLTSALFDQWRTQTDLFASVEGYLTKSVFLVGKEATEIVRTADVTPGLIELLGVAPRWGRSFVDDDTAATDAIPTLIGEAMARQRFGRPEAALGQTLETTAQPLLIVGVMPKDFRFPSGGIRLWRAMDPRGPLTYHFAGVMSVARVTPGLSLDALGQAMTARAQEIGATAGHADFYDASPAPFYVAAGGANRRTLFLTLLGAAGCLLLASCANAVSLDLAGAIQRSRTYAIQLALGASSATLRRMALIEGAVLIGAAVLAGLGLASMGLRTLVSYLPATIVDTSVNPIDLDERTIAFMATIAALSWLLASLPVVVFASRSRLLDLLKIEGVSTALSPGRTRLRHILTVAEVALAVLLITGGVLFARTYQALLAIDKGFDTTGVATIRAALPPQLSRGERAEMARIMTERVAAVPGVIGATEGSAPPFAGAVYDVGVELAVDDRSPDPLSLPLAVLSVDPAYFSVLRIPVRDGRFFRANEPPTSAIVTEEFARRFWPNTDPVGRRFRAENVSPVDDYEVVGVIRRPRREAEGTPFEGGEYLSMYVPRQPPPPPVPATEEELRSAATGGHYGYMSVIVRLESRARADATLQAARSVDPRFRVTLGFVDDEYAEAFSDTLLATRVIGGFGTVAFLVAIVGIYGLMAFLVASRQREIGIRMALGAGGRDISRLVLGSSLRLVLAGAVLGSIAALAAGRWIEARLFGVTPTDPATYGFVALVVIATAIAATWLPARRAARVDPVVSLRSD
jgi:putative ABC transport system permease protein